ncbi:MAG: PxKF domain-containing protein [Acidimicrobiales bacterium]
MKASFRKTVASAAVVGVLATVVGVANADDISNALDDTVDAVAEVMPLTLGGPDGTTQLYVIPRGGDGKSGCNLTGGTTLGVSIASTNPAVATVSPTNYTFTSCGGTPAITIAPVGQGTADITVTQTSNTTGGSFNFAPATFTVNVAPPPNTAPTVSVAGVTGGASYDKGAVPAATCQVIDAEDGNSSFPATLSGITGPYASDGIGSQEASCSYTDGGGLNAQASETYLIVDPSPPSIGHALNPASPDGANGWYKSNVSLTWNVSEPESPNSLQKTGCVDQNVTADQTATTYSCSALSAGGSAGPVDVTIQRDATNPTAALVGGPTDGATYYVGLDTIPAAPTCDSNDATSGIATCVVTGYSTAAGTHTVKATATDNAGNSADSSSITYTVRSLTLSGFYQPVDMGGVLNTVKGGSTVPMKFEVFAGQTELDATSIVQSFKAGTIACTGSAPTDEIEITSTGGTSLRYDTTAGQFVQNYATPKTAGACVRATLTLKGGQAISADFKLK